MGTALLAAIIGVAASDLAAPREWPDSRAALARLPLELRTEQDAAGNRALIARVEDVLALVEKRIQEVFDIRIDVMAVLGPSGEDYHFRLSAAERSGSPGRDGVLLINSTIVHTWQSEDLKIAAGRALYEAVWPKFRRLSPAASLLVQRLYDEGMTAYAAELLFPGAPKWKYAGLFGSGAAGSFKKYLSDEKDLARDTLRALSSGSVSNLFERLFSGPHAASSSRPSPVGSLLSYRIMKTFEKDIDPKMIQLMGIAEFRERLPGGLEALKKGFGGSNVREKGKP